jgi:carotenoid phi-ring synthase / carotenoid chi-ring synthase
VLIAQFHQLEDESRDWANATGGSVLEFHLYALEDDLATVPDDVVWERIRSTALEVVPELADAKVLGSTVGTYENFTSFGVGQGRQRPFPQTPAEDGLANLLLAGDWVQTTTPSALMERAVLTGRLAANECLLADGVRESAYSHVSPLGPTL